MHARRNGIIILIVTLSVFIALALAGCGAPPLEPEDTEPAPVPEGKFEAWNAANNPSWVDASSSLTSTSYRSPATGPSRCPPITGRPFATA
jgi:hypothetical protein